MLIDYKQHEVTAFSKHVLVMTQNEWDNFDASAKGYTLANNEVHKRWVVRHATMFPVEILQQH